MERNTVEVAMMRVADLRVGDVVNRDPSSGSGWFAIIELRQLPSGEINATGAEPRTGIMSSPYDIVGVQVRRVIETAGGRSPATTPAPSTPALV